MKYKHILLRVVLLTYSLISVTAAEKPSKSFYTQKPDDPASVYFTKDNFNISADGKTDVSIQLQSAINQLKSDRNFGISG